MGPVQVQFFFEFDGRFIRGGGRFILIGGSFIRFILIGGSFIRFIPLFGRFFHIFLLQFSSFSNGFPSFPDWFPLFFPILQRAGQNHPLVPAVFVQQGGEGVSRRVLPAVARLEPGQLGAEGVGEAFQS